MSVVLYSLFEKRRIVRSELRKFALVKRVAYLFHERVVKIKVVLNRKPSRKLFACFEQVAQVASGEIAAGRAVAFLVERLIVERVA